ncbi:hypothetical protein G7Y89_g12119 [Cudoniella acicularis]|uniref:Uncharacterized protein n=1 Tax=Cudoniella acicularis TaxID=354080 RepID=A0A8H4VZY9_9HELO|nr:hypothetical protein G7Y89_g12119 [Cudoniella acicularis]
MSGSRTSRSVSPEKKLSETLGGKEAKHPVASAKNVNITSTTPTQTLPNKSKESDSLPVDQGKGSPATQSNLRSDMGVEARLTGPLETALFEEPSSATNLAMEPHEKRSAPYPVASIAEKFQASQDQCEILKNRVFELQRNLQEAHGVIFSLQRQQQRLTETEAADDFKSLCGAVEELIGTKLGESLDEKLLMKEKSLKLEPSEMLLNLIPFPGRDAFKFPETDEHNITAAVMRFLCREIFNREFYCFIGEKEHEPLLSDFMRSVDKSMKNLEPRRDKMAYRTWRSETYTAITSRHEFGRIREKRIFFLTHCLTAMLLLFIPRADERKLHANIRHAIIEPAFALAHKMHLSVDYFTIEWSRYHNSQPSQRSSFPGGLHLHDLELIDYMDKGKLIRSAPSGNVHYMFDITPRLVFTKVKGDSVAEPKVLRKPKLLVSVLKEGFRLRDPASKSGEDITSLGWLERNLMSISKHRQRGR